MLVGHPGLGKTLWTQDTAAEVSRGDLLDKAAHVVLISGEDSLGVIRGRLLAAEADLTRVVSLRLKRDGEEVGIVIPDDLPTVERRIEQVGARLVMIDRVNAFCQPRWITSRIQPCASLRPCAHGGAPEHRRPDRHALDEGPDLRSAAQSRRIGRLWRRR